MEVNLSPSLACESPLDITIKSTLLSDILTLAGVKRFDRKKESLNKMKNRMKSYNNRGKSLNSRYTNIFNPLNSNTNAKDRNTQYGGVFSFNNTHYGANEHFNQPAN